MVALLNGQSGLHVQSLAVQRQCACVCVFAPTPLQLLEAMTALVGDSKLNIVNQRNALIDLVNILDKSREKHWSGENKPSRLLFIL